MREQLPGDEVAVVLHFGEDNQVSGRDIGITPAIGHKIDAFSGVACEDDLFALASVDEAGYFHARPFHLGGSFLADLVDTAMDVGMSGLVIGAHGLNDTIGLLRTRRAVEVNQRFAVYLAREYWEVFANICRCTCSGVLSNSLLYCRHWYVVGA